ncbi:hypothetical protein M514_09548 [Trichuris suis]|uniref:Uncharacterized protein n=1 Tax=Trichuris suis TaxID=68888 RepID=A0A085LXA9_9BILA|nr:hypothetical protein M513_09548 [Trichuris suis]KFD70168.1 hypothetical protein M514_09548 [Trichuris suis]
MLVNVPNLPWASCVDGTEQLIFKDVDACTTHISSDMPEGQLGEKNESLRVVGPPIPLFQPECFRSGLMVSYTASKLAICEKLSQMSSYSDS